jgi:hypothetical protein
MSGPHLSLACSGMELKCWALLWPASKPVEARTGVYDTPQKWQFAGLGKN